MANQEECPGAFVDCGGEVEWPYEETYCEACRSLLVREEIAGDLAIRAWERRQVELDESDG
jgi:hypothetical protein